MNVPEAAAAAPASAPKIRLVLQECHVHLHVDREADQDLADFIRTIATLISRAEYPHDYRVTAGSLHNAFSCGLNFGLKQQLYKHLDNPRNMREEEKSAMAAFMELVDISWAAWLTLPSASIQEKSPWKVTWPGGARLSISNCGELFMMLSTPAVRKSLIEDTTQSASANSARAALKLVSFELAIACKRPRDGDGEERVCQRVSGVHQELAALQARGQLRKGLRFEMRPVESIAHMGLPMGHAETFTLHTAPHREQGEIQKLTEMRSRLEHGEVGVMKLPTGGMLALAAVHAPPQPSGAFVLAFFTMSAAGGVLAPDATSATPSAQEMVRRAALPPSSMPLDPVEFRLPRVDCAITRHIQEHIASIPLTYTYRFSAGSGTPQSLRMQLKDEVRLRGYQEKAISCTVRGGAVQGGLIVLPCGAGKTLTGIAVACEIGQSVVIVCPHLGSVEQWRKSLLSFTNIAPLRIVRLTSAYKDKLPGFMDETGHTYNLHGGNGMVLLTTYSMVGPKRATHKDAATPLGWACKRAWGLLILDEVHMAPASEYQHSIQRLGARCVVGLTATLLREDGGIDSIPRLIGPVLYEAHAKDLEAANPPYLAPVQCCEVSCDMPAAFGEAYTAAMEERTNAGYQHAHLVAAFNPSKLRCAAALAKLHAVQRREKTIIFCERPKALQWFAEHVPIEWADVDNLMGGGAGTVRTQGLPYLDGKVEPKKREKILASFRRPDGVPAICLSSVGDEAIDLPNAQIAIQISSNHGSRRQEVQRLGRLQRVTPGSTSDALFYSLLSEGTMEVDEGARRQEYMRNQGYTIVRSRLERDLTAGDTAGYGGAAAAGPQALALVPEGGARNPVDDVLGDCERELLEELRRVQPDMA